MKKLLIKIVLPGLMLSCSERTDTTFYSKGLGNDNVQLIERSKIAAQYNALEGWDSSRRYTSQVQDDISQADSLISANGEVLDFEKQGATVRARLRNREFDGQNWVADIELTSDQYDRMKTGAFDRRERIGGTFIIKVFEITVLNPHVYTEFHEDDRGEAEMAFAYDFDENIIRLKGRCVNFELRNE